MFFTVITLLISGSYFTLMSIFVTPEWWYYLIWLVTSIPVFYLSMIVMVLLYSITFNKWLPVNNKFKAFMYHDVANWALIWIFNVHVKTTGRKNIPKKGNLVIYANHKTDLDPLLAVVAITRQVSFTPKSELYHYWPINAWLDAIAAIRIYRDDDRMTLKELVKGINNAKNGLAYMIYAEGCIKDRSTDRITQDLKAGSFKLGQKAEADILPISVHNNHLVGERSPFKNTKVAVTIHPLIKFEDIKDLSTVELGTKIKEIINSDFEEENV